MERSLSIFIFDIRITASVSDKISHNIQTPKPTETIRNLGLEQGTVSNLNGANNYVTVPAGSVKRSVSIGVPGIQVTASLTHQIPHYTQMTLPVTSQS